MEQIQKKNPQQVHELKTVNFTPKTDVDEYLDDSKFNAEIFHDLKDRFWGKQFEALGFFNLLYEQYAIICANKNKPLAVITHILALGLTEHQSLFFLPKLLELLSAGHDPDYNIYADTRLMRCHDFIKKSYDELNYKFYGNYKNLPRSFIFENAIEHSKTLSTTKEKIDFLINSSTLFKQNKKSLGPLDDIDFDEKCELEIIKLEKLLKLNAPPQRVIKSDFKLSLRQIALLYCYEEKPITRGDNANSIALENNHNSGDKLYQLFTFYNDRRHRIQIVGGSKIETTHNTKIKLLEGVIPLLDNNPKAKFRAIDELKLLKSNIE